MEYFLIAAGIVILVLFCQRFVKKQNREHQLNDRFGVCPNKLDHANLQSVSKYWDAKRDAVPKPEALDALTWNDLDMDGVFHRINMCSSSVGEAYLYALLHEPTTDLAVLAKREALLQRLEGSPTLRKKLQAALLTAGKRENNGMESFLFAAETKGIWNVWRYRIQAIIPLLCFGAMVFSLPLGGLLLIASAFANGLTYMRKQWRIENELNAIKYLSAILRCSRKVQAISDEALEPYITALKESVKPFRFVTNRVLQMTMDADIDWNFILEYFKLLFMYDFLRFNKIVRLIRKHTDDLRRVWDTLGELDAMISVLSFRQSLVVRAVPKWTEEATVEMKEVYHPLITGAVRNSLALSRNCFVTGSNASGKSTFIKSVAINAILAQTIHTCTARVYHAMPCRVLTSMAVKDDVVEGDSYFIAEIKSLKRVMDAVSGKTRCLCFIDEILKGTNTVERIAASAAIANNLCGQNCLCMVATHDIELPQLMGEQFMNVHFSETVTDDGIAFSYMIQEGVSQTRNAIKLLDFMDFDKTIVTDAEDMVQWYTDNRQWKNLHHAAGEPIQEDEHVQACGD